MDIAIEGFENVLKKAGAKKQNNSANRGNAILRELTIIAEEACNIARDAYPDRMSGGYDDHTRNLRGSICATIYYGGSEVKRCGFDGLGSAEGEAIFLHRILPVWMESRCDVRGTHSGSEAYSLGTAHPASPAVLQTAK